MDDSDKILKELREINQKLHSIDVSTGWLAIVVTAAMFVWLAPMIQRAFK
jgi:hypothetical protein